MLSTEFLTMPNAIILDGPANFFLPIEPDIKQVLAALLCCCILLLSSFLARPRPRKDDYGTRTALQSLMSVIVPTCSLWPSRYTKLARCSRSRISIPIESIIEDFTEGIIEFRNPVEDLANLICPGITAYGRTMALVIGWKWWVDAFRWWAVTKYKPDSFSPGTPIFGPFTSPLVSSSPDSGPVICLDYQAPGFIPSLTTGGKLTLEFTAFSSFRSLDTKQVISTIPFILSPGSTRCPRSPVSVLEQLSTVYGSDLVVNSLSNISVDYESTLCHLLDFVYAEQKTRDMGMKAFGLKGWRRGMFLIALEAALVRRGLLERWAVHVTIK